MGRLQISRADTYRPGSNIIPATQVGTHQGMQFCLKAYVTNEQEHLDQVSEGHSTMLLLRIGARADTPFPSECGPVNYPHPVCEMQNHR